MPSPYLPPRGKLRHKVFFPHLQILQVLETAGRSVLDLTTNRANQGLGVMTGMLQDLANIL